MSFPPCAYCGVVTSRRPLDLIVKGVPVRGVGMRQTLRYVVCSLFCGAKVLERRSDGQIGVGSA